MRGLKELIRSKVCSIIAKVEDHRKNEYVEESFLFLEKEDTVQILKSFFQKKICEG